MAGGNVPRDRQQADLHLELVLENLDRDLLVPGALAGFLPTVTQGPIFPAVSVFVAGLPPYRFHDLCQQSSYPGGMSGQDIMDS